MYTKYHTVEQLNEMCLSNVAQAKVQTRVFPDPMCGPGTGMSYVYRL